MELIPWNSQWPWGHLGTGQICAGDLPGLMGRGQGHQMAKPRSGRVVAMLLGGLGSGTPETLQMGALQGHLPTLCWPCPQGSGRDLAAGTREGQGWECSEGLGPTTGVSKPPGPCCASSLCTVLCCCHT